jgi:hypothetical protein
MGRKLVHDSAVLSSQKAPRAKCLASGETLIASFHVGTHVLQVNQPISETNDKVLRTTPNINHNPTIRMTSQIRSEAENEAQQNLLEQ